MNRWLVAKYMPDLRRREPINIGVVLVSGDGRVRTRFLAEGARGIDGRRLKLVRSSDNYRAWIAYWRELAAGGATWDELVSEARRSAPTSYYLEVGGEALRTEHSDERFLAHLFDTLVDLPAPVPKHSATDVLFEHAGVAVERDVSVEIPIPMLGDDATDEVFFDYRYTNGRVTLMRSLTLGRGKTRWDHVHSARYGFEAVAGAALGTPVALVRRTDDVPAGQMKLLRECSEVVDVSDQSQAVQRIRSLLLHD